MTVLSVLQEVRFSRPAVSGGVGRRSNPLANPSTTLKEKGTKGNGGRIQPASNRCVCPFPMGKGHACGAFPRWRDPDSNRGHHDFQARDAQLGEP